MKEQFGPMAPYCPNKRPLKDRRKYDAAGLWSKWYEYVAYVNATPVPIPKQSLYKGDVVHYQDVKYRPYVKSEFLRFAAISEKTWRNYKKSEKLAEVIEEIENIIYEQKLIGAYVNHFNATIVAQDLGMKTAVEQTNRDGNYEDHMKLMAKNRKEQKAYEQRRGIKSK